ncbi:MAG: diacylglycerol kinase [Caldimonas sp.]
MNLDNEFRPSIGPGRLAGALRYSIAGFSHAARREAAFQQELLVSLALLPLVVLLPLTTLERLMLVLSMLFVLVVELLNSAIEATVDRISAERHPLAGQAKDMGSAAVFVALAMSVLCWVVIAGPAIGGWVTAALR